MANGTGHETRASIFDRSIQSKLVTGLLGIASVGLLCFAIFVSWQVRATFLESQELSTEGIALSRRAGLERIFADWLAQTERIAESRLVSNSLKMLQETGYTRYRKRLARTLSRHIDTGVVFVQVLGDEQRFAIEAGQPPSDLLEDQTASKSLRGPTLEHITWSPSDPEQMRVHMLAPIKTSAKVIGHVRVILDGTRLLELAADRHGLGRSGEAIFLHRSSKNTARIVTPVRDYDFTAGSAVPLGSEGGILSSPFHAPATPTTRPTDHRGVRVVISALPAIENQLGLIVKIDESEVLEPLAELRLVLVVVGVLCGGIIAFLGFMLSRALTAPIMHLVEVADQISSGQRRVRATIQSRDEIGLLAARFNEMAEELTRSNAELEQRVKDRTAALDETNSRLELRATELARSNADLEQFASVASHDLQEPLRKVQAFGDRLKLRYRDQLDERGNGYIDRMQNSAERMQILIQDLLTFSRVSSRGQPFQTVELDAVLRDVLGDLEVVIQETQATVHYEQLPAVKGDQTQLRQLIQNLIGNALKYREADTPPLVQVRHKECPDHLQLEFEDNGIGFESRYEERIFGIFQRLHGRDAYAGTGVGLAICRKIAERHQGRLYARSKPGVGSVFTFELPYGPAEDNEPLHMERTAA